MTDTMRLNNKNGQNLYLNTQRIILEINRIFADEDVEKLTPDQRFYLLAILLRWPESNVIALEDIVREKLEISLNPSIMKAVEEIGKAFFELCKQPDGNSTLTYTAMGYWGAVGQENNRRSIFHRREIASESERKKSLAYALCFLALTFAGIKKEEEQTLYSVTQYTATKAPDLPGINVEYLEESAEAKYEDMWPIGVKAGQELLQFLGWSSWIEQIVAEYDEQALTLALRGALNRSAPDERIEEEARDFICSFNERVSRLPEDPKKELARAEHYLTKAFYNGREYSQFPITSSRACFMIATHMMWRAACPSDFTYTFTVPLLDPLHDNTTCTLTVGTFAPIDIIAQLSISSIAWALFGNPLIMDYSLNVELRQRAESFRASTRLLGHNVPNLALSPCIAQFVQIEKGVKKALAFSDADCCPESCRELLEDVRNRSQVSIELFEHYERLLTYLLGSESIVDTFKPKFTEHNDDEILSENQKMDEGIIPFLLGEIFEPLSHILERHKEQYILGHKVREELVEEFDVDWTEAIPFEGMMILEQRSLLREVLFNLVHNALFTIDNSCLESGRGTVKVVSRLVDDQLQIDVIDRGKGFRDKREDHRQAISEVLATDSSIDFEKKLNELVSRQSVEAPQGTLGLGLLFCAAYARSREWFAGTKGDLIIDPPEMMRENSGAVVRLVIPLKRLSETSQTILGQ